MCEAVQHAHQHLIIHRDLKPSNILVTNDGGVKLLDFGIAKQLESLEAAGDQTRTGLRLMTPAYAAPEQLRGGRVGIHTDIYALGVILYELLTGRVPFDPRDKTSDELASLIAEHAATAVDRRARARVASDQRRGGLAERVGVGRPRRAVSHGDAPGSCSADTRRWIR